MRSRPQRHYSANDLALFARYIQARTAHMPEECDGSEECWVVRGPPCYSMTNQENACTGCKGKIRVE